MQLARRLAAMGKAIKILLIGLGIWAGLEIYLEGTEHAFGGILAPSNAAREAHAEARSTPQRAGDSVRNSLAREADRHSNIPD
jgi:hypothetical protein